MADDTGTATPAEQRAAYIDALKAELSGQTDPERIKAIKAELARVGKSEGDND